MRYLLQTLKNSNLELKYEETRQMAGFFNINKIDFFACIHYHKG